MSSTIELNGKKYDTSTGRVLDIMSHTKSAANQPSRPHHVVKKKPSTGVYVDGFVRAVSKPLSKPVQPKDVTPASHIGHSVPATNTPAKAIPVGVKHKKDVSREVRHLPAHKPGKSKTLMRTAVKKPQTNLVQAIAAPLHSEATNSYSDDFDTPFFTRHKSHANNVTRSALISRFNENQPTVVKTSAPLEVKPAPAHSSHHTDPKIHHAPSESSRQQASPSKSEALFSKALEHATTHQQPHHDTHHKDKATSRHSRRKNGIKRRLVTTGTVALSTLLLAGFFAYQNVPNFAMRLAAARAGFDATLPSYQPAGFALQGPIQYGPGQISVSFKSNTDDRAFKITQSPSNWNSETLLDQFVATDRRAYQSYQDNGKTVYIYGGANATWVDGGVWYQIESESSLSSDQLLKVAASL